MSCGGSVVITVGQKNDREGKDIMPNNGLREQRIEGWPDTWPVRGDGRVPDGSPRRNSWLCAIAAISALGIALGIETGAASAGDQGIRSALAAFTPDCRDPAPGYAIRDPEFYSAEPLATWISESGTGGVSALQGGALNIAPIDPNTGDFVITALTELPNAMALPMLPGPGGPEWGCSSRGPESFFTSVSQDGTDIRLARASRNGSGDWIVNFLPNSDGKGGGFVSQNCADNAPNIAYANTLRYPVRRASDISGYGWRKDTPQPTDVDLPENSGMGRWMPGADSGKLLHHVNLQTLGDLVQATAIYDTATRTDTIIMNDGKDRPELKSWSAPELKGRSAIAATVRSNSKDEAYLEIRKRRSSGKWVVWKRILSPDPVNYPCVGSPEPFVYQNRSYVVLVARTSCDQPTQVRGKVFFAQVSPSPSEGGLERVVSEDSDDPDAVTIKNDPEVVVLGPNKGVRIYYADWGWPKASTAGFVSCAAGL